MENEALSSQKNGQAAELMIIKEKLVLECEEKEKLGNAG